MKGQLNLASIFSDWPRLCGIFRGSAPLSDAAGGKKKLVVEELAVHCAWT